MGDMDDCMACCDLFRCLCECGLCIGLCCYCCKDNKESDRRGPYYTDGATTTTVISQPGPYPGQPYGGGYPPQNAPYQAAQMPMPQPGSYPVQPSVYPPPPGGGPYPQGPMPGDPAFHQIGPSPYPPYGYPPQGPYSPPPAGGPYPPPAGGPYPPPAGGPYPPPAGGPYPPPAGGPYPPPGGPSPYLPSNPAHPPPYDIAMSQPPAPMSPHNEGYGKQAPYNPHY